MCTGSHQTYYPETLFFLQKPLLKCVHWVNLQPVNWSILMQRNLQNITKYFWHAYFQMEAGLIQATTIHKISGTVGVSLVSKIVNWKCRFYLMILHAEANIMICFIFQWLWTSKHQDKWWIYIMLNSGKMVGVVMCSNLLSWETRSHALVPIQGK